MKRVQIISPANRRKRLDARAFWESEEYDFRHYLFVDECTVVLGREQQFCWVREGEKVPCQGRFRHGSGFHVFGGISWRGATDVLVWSSKHRMKSPFYCNNNIKEIIAKSGHLFEGGQFELVQDNHPAHVSYYTQEYLQNLGIITCRWSPQSPDRNGIEFVWRDMKAFIKEKAPRTLKELQDAIHEFSSTKVTPAYCRRVISHSINNIKRSYDGLNHEKDKPTDILYQKYLNKKICQKNLILFEINDFSLYLFALIDLNFGKTDYFDRNPICGSIGDICDGQLKNISSYSS